MRNICRETSMIFQSIAWLYLNGICGTLLRFIGLNKVFIPLVATECDEARGLKKLIAIKRSSRGLSRDHPRMRSVRRCVLRRTERRSIGVVQVDGWIIRSVAKHEAFAQLSGERASRSVSRLFPSHSSFLFLSLFLSWKASPPRKRETP